MFSHYRCDSNLTNPPESVWSLFRALFCARASESYRLPCVRLSCLCQPTENTVRQFSEHVVQHAVTHLSCHSNCLTSVTYSAQKYVARVNVTRLVVPVYVHKQCFPARISAPRLHNRFDTTWCGTVLRVTGKGKPSVQGCAETKPRRSDSFGRFLTASSICSAPRGTGSGLKSVHTRMNSPLITEAVVLHK